MTSEFKMTPRAFRIPYRWQPLAVFVVILLCCVGLERVLALYAKAGREAMQAQVAAVTADMPKIVAKFTYRQQLEGATPTLIWSGADARILLVTQTMLEHAFETEPVWYVTARTSRGNYFRLQYRLHDDGSGPYVSHFEPLELSEAQEAVFRAGKADLYKELFGAPMPRTDEPA